MGVAAGVTASILLSCSSTGLCSSVSPEGSSSVLLGLGVFSSPTGSAGVGLGDFLREPWKVDL